VQPNVSRAIPIGVYGRVMMNVIFIGRQGVRAHLSHDSPTETPGNLPKNSAATL
jgi:hypothetical protein